MVNKGSLKKVFSELLLIELGQLMKDFLESTYLVIIIGQVLHKWLVEDNTLT